MAEIEHNWYQIGTALDVPFGILQGMYQIPGADGIRLSRVIYEWHKNKKKLCYLVYGSRIC